MKISFVLIAMLLTSCQAAPRSIETGLVTRVTSGQTIEVRLNSQIQTVSLLGVEAPDPRQQPWANQAKQRLQELIEGQIVRLEFAPIESTSYRSALVWLDRAFVNEQLIEEGLVLVRSNVLSPYDDRLAHAQEKARILGQGIWNPSQPMRQTPTQFRTQAAS
ncbi:thermonuclease family protein [Microcoleus sp. FACHB-1515]|uniref:thermonuclease family protein n=1 Tax=Cyanophyceae TaxID=3028117 RepID=UPI0019B996BE|nr:thermonuclease family protein [Microcoleus sp. FACHB-1515]MBD2093114.1 thermonuclease family protein [Microcoleus sp. FACHB-1515]